MLQQEQNKRNLTHLTDKEIKINYKTKQKKKPDKQVGGLIYKNSRNLSWKWRNNIEWVKTRKFSL